MSDFSNNRLGETSNPAANLDFAPVQPIEIEPAFAGTTAPSNADSKNPFRSDVHSGSHSGVGSGLNTGVTSTSLDGTSSTTPFKSDSTTGSTTTTQQKAGNLAQTAIDSLPTQETVINSASNAASTIANHPITQNAINHPITQNAINGPVATSVKDEAYRTQSEFANLAASRAPPGRNAATGQPLTHYHSFFTTLLSWDNPRASGLAYAAIVIFIFAARYLHILRYFLKLTWVTLGVTVLAELAGQTVLNTGLTSQFRPRKYFTISKDTLNAVVGDVHELINFFVIETQRIVFVENVLISGTVLFAAFIGYYLVKVVPFWGLTLIGTSVTFLGPLIYKTNKELIDAQIERAASLANQQAAQTKRIVSEQSARAYDSTKAAVGDYSSKAQELVGTATAKVRSASPTTVKKENAQNTLKHNTNPVTTKDTSSTTLNKDFPSAPKNDFVGAPPTTSFPVAPSSDLKKDPIAL